jgi:hypothetical protein
LGKPRMPRVELSMAYDLGFRNSTFPGSRYPKIGQLVDF